MRARTSINRYAVLEALAGPLQNAQAAPSCEPGPRPCRVPVSDPGPSRHERDYGAGWCWMKATADPHPFIFAHITRLSAQYLPTSAQNLPTAARDSYGKQQTLSFGKG